MQQYNYIECRRYINDAINELTQLQAEIKRLTKQKQLLVAKISGALGHNGLMNKTYHHDNWKISINKNDIELKLGKGVSYE